MIYGGMDSAVYSAGDAMEMHSYERYESMDTTGTETTIPDAGQRHGRPLVYK